MAHQIRPSTLANSLQHRHAFTLVELLVVIAIMSLLIALLLPALSRARSVAKSTVCMSNLRQWGLGILMYANDNEGMVPLLSVSSVTIGKNAGGGSVTSWSEWLNETKYVPGGDFAASGSALFKSGRVGFCPESPYNIVPVPPAAGWLSIWYSTYDGNGMLNYKLPVGIGLNWASPYAVYKSLPNPAAHMLVSEVQVPQQSGISLIYPDQNGASPQNQLAQYHPDKSSNGLFGDGHVENMLLKSFGGWAYDYNANPKLVPYPWRAQ